MGEELRVCALGIVWGGWEEALRRCVDPQCHSERDMGQVSMLFFYNSCTLVIGTVPYIDRCVVVVK